MAIDSVASLVAVLGESRLLDPPQQEELVRRLQGQYADPRALARALLDRGWLTPYHINQLFQGRSQDLVIGQYVILERLGEGGMGQVFKARHQKLGRIVALKVIRKDRLASENAVRRFQREIRSAAQLSHPNIVMAYDADQIGDLHSIIMEFVEGIDLSKLLKKHGRLPIPQACDYARQAALGLQHAFERGLVHRDIKPSNVLVTQATGANMPTPWGLVKILDMGLARATELDNSEHTASLTHAGAVVGTPDYVAPEQARNSKAADMRSDIYSLGCTLYHMLTGQVPFPDGTGMEKIFKHQLEAPRPLEQLRPEVPAALGKVVRSLMAKKPEDRPQLPSAAAAALEPFIKGKGSFPGVPLFATGKSARAAALDPTLADPERGATPQVATKRKRTSGLPRQDRGSATAVPPAGEGTRPGGKKRWLPLAVATGLLLVIGVASTFFLSGSPRNEPSGKNLSGDPGLTSGTGSTPPGVARSFLDQLDPGKIPPEQRVPDLQRELVAVLGDGTARHWGAIRTAVFSPDSKLLATAGMDRTIRVWNVANRQQVAAIPSMSPWVVGLAFRSDSRTLVGMIGDQTLRGWEIPSGKLLGTMNIPPAEGRPTKLSPDGQYVILFGKEGASRLWDLARTQEHQPAIALAVGQDLAFSPDGKTVAVWSRTGGATPIKVLDLATGEERSTLITGKEPISSVVLAGDGKKVVALQGGKTLKLWDAAGKELLARDVPGNVMGAALSADGQSLAVSGMDRVLLVNAATGQVRGSLSAHAGGFTPVLTFSPDGKLLATVGGFDSGVRLWDATTGQELWPSPGHHGPVMAVSVTRDGATLASSSFTDHGAKLWDIASGKVRATLPGPPATSLKALCNDDRAALTQSNNLLALWDLATGARLQTQQTVGNQFAQLAVAANGKTGVWVNLSFDGKFGVGASQTARVLDLATLQDKGKLDGIQATGLYTVALTADGKTAASVESKDGSTRLRLWDTATGKDTGVKLPPVKGTALAVAISPDGKTVAGSFQEGAIKLWETATGKELVSLQEKPEPARRFSQQPPLLFSADGSTLLAWNSQGMQAWEVATGRERVVFKGHKEPLTNVLFSPNGKGVVSSDQEGHLVFWDVVNGKAIRQLKLPGAPNSLAFAADGRHVITGNSNGTIYVLRLASAER